MAKSTYNTNMVTYQEHLRDNVISESAQGVQVSMGICCCSQRPQGILQSKSFVSAHKINLATGFCFRCRCCSPAPTHGCKFKGSMSKSTEPKMMLSKVCTCWLGSNTPQKVSSEFNLRLKKSIEILCHIHPSTARKHINMLPYPTKCVGGGGREIITSM